MSDTTLNKFISYGTAAERASFTPDPPAGVNILYIWYETDTNDVYAFVDPNWFLIVSGAGIVQVAVKGVTIDGAGSAITTGIKGYVSVPATGEIVRVRLLADQVGDAVVDIWLDTFANYPPTVADTITASAKPTLSAADSYEDTTLTGWTTAVTAGDVLAFNVDSAATITRLTVELWIAS